MIKIIGGAHRPVRIKQSIQNLDLLLSILQKCEGFFPYEKYFGLQFFFLGGGGYLIHKSILHLTICIHLIKAINYFMRMNLNNDIRKSQSSLPVCISDWPVHTLFFLNLSVLKNPLPLRTKVCPPQLPELSTGDDECECFFLNMRFYWLATSQGCARSPLRYTSFQRAELGQAQKKEWLDLFYLKISATSWRLTAHACAHALLSYS